MSAIVTDQFRKFNAGNFVDSVLSDNNSYYVFLSLSNPGTDPTIVGFGRTDTWNSSPPAPTDNLQYETQYRSTSLFGKKVNSTNIRRVIRKVDWKSNTPYDMYRQDYSISNMAPVSKTGRLYDANYYVVNSDYNVYVCLDNGSFGYEGDGTDNYKPGNSKDEPTFTDLEPSAAGTSNDGYIWKYLFSISPSDIIKFDSTEYIVVPNDWETSTNSQIQKVREAGDSTINFNQIKTVYIADGGSDYINQTATVDILGDGTGAKASVTTSNGTVTSVVITAGGTGYTKAPAVTISAPSEPWGVKATAVTEIKNGSVSAIEVVSNGRGYTSTPTITIGAPNSGINTATATLELIPTYYSIKESTPISSGISTVTLDDNVPYAVGVGSTVPFHKQSRILASSHSFEYIGTGVDPLNSLPNRGAVPIQDNEIDDRNGGLTIFTSTDQQGQFRIGDGVIIDQQTGTISGNFYSKSLFSTMTPFILALGGD